MENTMNNEIKLNRKRKARMAHLFSSLDSILTYIILIAVCFIFLFPVLWLVLASFSKGGSMYDFDGFFPKSYSVSTFAKLFTDIGQYNYPRWFLNTLIVAISSCVIGSFLTILTAYTMSRLKFKARKGMMKLTLILGMFPSFMAMTVLFLLLQQLHLVNNLLGLILIYSTGAPLGFMVQKGFFDTLPKEIDEAAIIDGANKFQIFTKITLPMSKPMLVYTALTSFTWPWSDFILPKILLPSKNLWTVAVGLNSLDTTEFARFAAGSVFIGVPIVILYFLLSKFLVEGISSGSVKG